MALGRTVAELENSISNTELNEWAEYYSLEPFMVDRNEYQMAQLSQMVATFMGAKDVKVSDFMPSVDKKEKAESKQSALLTKVKALFKVE